MSLLKQRVSFIGGRSGCSWVSVSAHEQAHSEPPRVWIESSQPHTLISTKVLLRIDGVLCAAVALALPQSLHSLRVAMFSIGETKQGVADAWGASQLLTFKCASSNGHRILIPA